MEAELSSSLTPSHSTVPLGPRSERLRLIGVVLLLVNSQILFPGKPLSAELAGKRPLPRVHALVGLQVPRLREAFPALGTAERPLPRVHPDVRLQPPRRREVFPAVRAAESPVAAEPVQVQLGRAQADEGEGVQVPVRPGSRWNRGNGARAVAGPCAARGRVIRGVGVERRGRAQGEGFVGGVWGQGDGCVCLYGAPCMVRLHMVRVQT